MERTEQGSYKLEIATLLFLLASVLVGLGLIVLR